MPARARSERLRGWTPPSRESGHVGHAGVGVVSLRGVPLSLPALAIAVSFRSSMLKGGWLGDILPLAKGRIVHLVVICGFQGASTDFEKLRLAEKLLNSVLCELAVVGSGQPRLTAGDVNLELARVPGLQKGIMAGHLFDLQASWAAAAGLDPALTCKQVFGATSGSRREFLPWVFSGFGCFGLVSSLGVPLGATSPFCSCFL